MSHAAIEINAMVAEMQLAQLDAGGIETEGAQILRMVRRLMQVRYCKCSKSNSINWVNTETGLGKNTCKKRSMSG